MNGNRFRRLCFILLFLLCFAIHSVRAASPADLGQAAEKGDAAAVSLMLAGKPDLEARDANGETALMRAAQNDHLDVVNMLLAAGASINALNKYDQTALTDAASEGHAAIVQRLLDKGADLSLKDIYGMDTLLYAARSGDVATVRVLLDKAADINATDKHGLTPLFHAAAQGKTEAVRLLLDRHADANKTELTGHTALFAALMDGHDDLARMLKAAGARPSDADSQALMAVAFSGKGELLQKLLDIGTNPNVEFKNGLTPLLVAENIGRPDAQAAPLVKILLDAGADANGVAGNAPLLIAALGGKTETTRLLLEHHADIAAQMKPSGLTAFMLATARALAGAHTPFPPGDPLGTIAVLVAHGADINARMSKGQTALVQALLARNAPTARFLIAHGADVRLADEEGQTPLMAAAQAGLPDIVRLILARDHSPNRKDEQGRTALARTHGPITTEALVIGPSLPQHATIGPLPPLPGQPAVKDEGPAIEAGREEAARLLKAAGGKQ